MRLPALPGPGRAKVAAPSGESGPEPFDRRWIVLVAAWCGVYLLQLCTWKTVYPRYLLPLWPALAVLAGCGASMAVDQVLREQGHSRFRLPRRAVLAAAAVLLIGPGLYPLGRSVAARLRPDPRVPLSAFLAANVRPGEGIGIETGGPWVSNE